MKNKKYFYVILAATLAALGYLFYKKQKDDDAADTATAPPTTTGTENTGAQLWPLKIGSSGRAVKYLQAWLNKYAGGLFPALTIDGNLGALTRAAMAARALPYPLNADKYQYYIGRMEADLSNYAINQFNVTI